MRLICISLIFALCFSTLCFAQDAGAQRNAPLLDDFEGVISGGTEGTVDFGAGNGSSIEVTAASDNKYAGNQALKVIYDAVSGGYMYIAKGFGLDAKNAGWLVKPETIDWNKYSGISFYMFGSDSKSTIAVDIKDNGNEMWRFLLEDNFSGWKQIVCPFTSFYVRSDWQPDMADKNAELNFPVKSYQFESLPVSKGIFYFDNVELIERKENS